MSNFVPPLILSAPVATMMLLVALPHENLQLDHLDNGIIQDRNSHANLVEPVELQFTDYRELLSEIDPRPLFSETRRPPSVQPTTEDETEIAISFLQDEGVTNEIDPSPPNIELIGFFERSDRRRALIINRDTHLEQWVSEGDKLGEWRIGEVTTSYLRINFADNEHIVRLKR